MDSSEVVKVIIEFIRQRWYRKSTLLILVLFSIGILLWIFSGINLREIEQEEIWIGVTVLLVVVAIWLYSNLPPRASKSRIGFAVGIRTGDPEQQLKIKRDFIDALRALLYKSNYKYNFEFVEIPDRLLEKIDSLDAAQKILYELGCKFMIYGKARTTMLRGEMQHVLNLEGVVAHRPITNQVRKAFSKEFAQLLPRQLMISSEGDLFKFELTANWIDVVSKYIIGTAALLSGDFEYAQELFESLQTKLQDDQTEFYTAIRIRDRLPKRLRDVYLIRISLCYENWKHTKDIKDIERMKPFLDALDFIAPENADAKIFRSMWHFVVARDIANAKNECIKGKNKQNIAWRYNYAFLFAYEGNLDRAFKEYKQAFRGYYSYPGFIFDIVDFILWALDREPDKAQLYFCLGLIYYYVIGDYSLALQDFERFLEFSQPDFYPSQRDEAHKLISTIRKDIEAGKIKLVS